MVEQMELWTWGVVGGAFGKGTKIVRWNWVSFEWWIMCQVKREQMEAHEKQRPIDLKVWREKSRVVIWSTDAPGILSSNVASLAFWQLHLVETSYAFHTKVQDFIAESQGKTTVLVEVTGGLLAYYPNPLWERLSLGEDGARMVNQSWITYIH